MSTEKHTVRKAGVLFLPVVMAAPIIAALVFLIARFGPTIRKLLNILIKMAVAS